jgi:hypothetical protein
VKQTIGLICLALFCLGVAYQIVLHLGTMLILFAIPLALLALLIALFRAPEGYERPDGFHVCARSSRRRRRVRGVHLVQSVPAAR